MRHLLRQGRSNAPQPADTATGTIRVARAAPPVRISAVTQKRCDRRGERPRRPLVCRWAGFVGPDDQPHVEVAVVAAHGGHDIPAAHRVRKRP